MLKLYSVVTIAS